MNNYLFSQGGSGTEYTLMNFDWSEGLYSRHQWWDKISDGGIVIIDDWALDGVRIACYEFFEQKGITPEIHTIPNSTPTYFFK